MGDWLKDAGVDKVDATSVTHRGGGDHLGAAPCVCVVEMRGKDSVNASTGNDTCV